MPFSNFIKCQWAFFNLFTTTPYLIEAAALIPEHWESVVHWRKTMVNLFVKEVCCNMDGLVRYIKSASPKYRPWPSQFHSHFHELIHQMLLQCLTSLLSNCPEGFSDFYYQNLLLMVCRFLNEILDSELTVYFQFGPVAYGIQFT